MLALHIFCWCVRNESDYWYSNADATASRSNQHIYIGKLEVDIPANPQSRVESSGTS
jgi:hypothetical protein